MTILKVRGLDVNVEIWNNEAVETIVLLHGFTGSVRTWEKVVSQFPSTVRAIAIDLIGHGKTTAPVEANRYSMEQQVADLEELFTQLQLTKFTLLGYSMGGRVALSYATAYPNRIKCLILESASPGLKTEEERAARRIADAQLAQSIEANGIETFVEKWENIPLFQSQKKLPLSIQRAIREERLSQCEIGLANSLRGMGTGSQRSLWPTLKNLTFPVYLITGSIDEKFCNIAVEMKKELMNAEHIVIVGAGHAIHVENPTQFATIVKKALTKVKIGGQIMAREWTTLHTYEDIKYEFYNGIAKITINRPEVRNAFRPKTVEEMIDAFSRARDDKNVGVIILTGEGEHAFCSGGDQKVRGHGGYVGDDNIPRLNVLDLQRLIRVIPKPVVAMVAGYAIGGGHVLHVVCDLTIAADNARFGQTGPKVGSFDAGYGSGYLARIIGHKKAREIWYLCRQYDAQQALDMGLVNTVVPYEQLEDETVQWCEEMLEMSPTALRFLKAAMNADTDGLAGLQQMAGDATLLYYTTDEAKEGRDAFKEKRKPDFGQFPRFP